MQMSFTHAYEEPNTTVNVNLPTWDIVAVTVGTTNVFLNIEQAERLSDLLSQVLIDRNFSKKDRA